MRAAAADQHKMVRISSMMQRIVQATAVVVLCSCAMFAADVFPAPREMTPSAGDFLLDEHVVIATPAQPSEEDRFLAKFLSDELGDRWDLHVATEAVNQVDESRRAIVIGRPHKELGPSEAYTLRISSNRISLDGS